MGQSAERAREPWGLWDLMLVGSLPDKPVDVPFVEQLVAEPLVVVLIVEPEPRVVMWGH